MFAYIDAYDLNPTHFSGTQEFYINLPSKCPCCSTAYSSAPSFSGFFQNELGTKRLYSLFFCPACEKAFFVIYGFLGDPEHDDLTGHISVQYPTPNNTTSFSDKLSTLSPKFVEIYHQAEQAENAGLSELCGIGYRKALEFLVKDYAIYNHPEEEETIKQKSLAQCIKNYIDNDRIKILAERSAWIGNDEAHYVRKQEDRNISDLKAFIEGLTYFISMILVTEDAASMSPK